MFRNRCFSNLSYFHIIALVFLISVSSLSAFGQTTGSVTGTVTDPSNAPVVGVEVRLTSPASGINLVTMSDAEGNFQFLLLPPGRLRVGSKHSRVQDVSAGRDRGGSGSLTSDSDWAHIGASE